MLICAHAILDGGDNMVKCGRRAGKRVTDHRARKPVYETGVWTEALDGEDNTLESPVNLRIPQMPN